MMTRIHWVDHAKGLGIFLVVLGHVLRALVEAKILPNNFWVSFGDHWIYAFHMPLFFLLSGLFIQRSTHKPLGVFIPSRIKTIMYPYFLWSLLQGGLQIFLSQYTNQKMQPRELINILYDPIMQFWFLYCLFLIIVFYALLRQATNDKTPLIFLIFSLIAYLSLLFKVNLGDWGVLYQVRSHLIYFAIGAIAGTHSAFLEKINSWSSKITVSMSLMGFLMVAIAVFLAVDNKPLIIPFIALCGIGATINLAIFLERFPWLNLIRDWGLFSLEIFVAHTIASGAGRIFLQKVFHLTNPSLHLIMGMLLGIYCPIILALWAKKLRFPYLFTWGDH